MKRIIGIILATALVCVSLFSCTNDKSPAVLTLGEYKITSAMYHYWASKAKAQYLSSYEDVENTDECWNSQLTKDKTVKEYFDAVTLESIKENLVAIKLFDEYGLKITDEEAQSIDDNIEDIIKEYADGNKNLMNTALSEYGINLSLLRKIYIEEAKTTKVFDYLYGEEGTEKLTDEDLESYYQENYVHFQLIYINNKTQYVKDENDNYVQDDEGYYETEELNEADKAKKDAAVAEVEKKLGEGEDFYELYEKYSELKAYENGYYYTAGGAYDDAVFYQLISAAMKLEAGETEKVDADSGVCFIMKLENDEGAYANDANSDFFEDFEDYASEAAYREIIKKYSEEITVDAEAIKEFSVSAVTPAYSF